MLMARAIPCLLLQGQGLVKTVRFGKPKYLGDPINAVRIFNDKEVDELVFLDVSATIEGRRPAFGLLEEVAQEAFMPLGYGGGVRSLDDVKTILSMGFEKVIINTYAAERPEFMREVADFAGSQSVVVSIDVKRSFWCKREVVIRGGRKGTGRDAVAFAQQMESCGVGEILLNSVDRDGTLQGYDLDLIRSVADAVTIPVVACGGARTVRDLGMAVRAGHASAAAAGSMFVFHGPHRAVLISYPSPDELHQAFGVGMTG